MSLSTVMSNEEYKDGLFRLNLHTMPSSGSDVEVFKSFIE